MRNDAGRLLCCVTLLMAEGMHDGGWLEIC